MKQMALLALVAALALAGSAHADGWTFGRSTHFRPEDAGPIENSNCHLKQSEISTGSFVAAFSDRAPEFQGSCGKCVEVRCKPASFKDGYGETLSREDACPYGDKSVIVTVADACPCEYPNNAFSNKRWCCGDMPHIDISEQAFKELNPDLYRVGVIGVEYRFVSCDTKAAPGYSSGPSSGSSPQQGGGNQQQSQQTSSGDTTDFGSFQLPAGLGSFFKGRWGGRRMHTAK